MVDQSKPQLNEAQPVLGLQNPDMSPVQPNTNTSDPRNTTNPPAAVPKVQIIRDDKGNMTGLVRPDGTALLGLDAKDVNSLANIYARRLGTPSNALEASQVAQNNQTPPQAPYQAPNALGNDVQPSGVDALDYGAVAGKATEYGGIGAGVGAGIGAAVAGIPTLGLAAIPGAEIGAAAGAIIGAGIGAATAFYDSVAAERKQQSKVSFVNFKDATKNMQNIMADANARHVSKQQSRANWDNEYQRVLQSERELQSQQKALFGEKLSRSLDELSKIEAWKRNYAQYNFEFEQALAQPNPDNIMPAIADTSSDSELPQ